jgi:hypothetical protein
MEGDSQSATQQTASLRYFRVRPWFLTAWFGIRAGGCYRLISRKYFPEPEMVTTAAF